MIGDEDSQDALAVAKALTASMDGLAGRLDAVTKYGHRNRHMIWGLVASIVLDVALTIALVGVAFATNSANNKANRTHDQQISTCLSTNEARKANVQLWDYVLSVKSTQPLTETQLKQIADFKVYVHKVLAPRDCSKI